MKWRGIWLLAKQLFYYLFIQVTVRVLGFHWCVGFLYLLNLALLGGAHSRTSQIVVRLGIAFVHFLYLVIMALCAICRILVSYSLLMNKFCHTHDCAETKILLSSLLTQVVCHLCGF